MNDRARSGHRMPESSPVVTRTRPVAVMQAEQPAGPRTTQPFGTEYGDPNCRCDTAFTCPIREHQ